MSSLSSRSALSSSRSSGISSPGLRSLPFSSPSRTSGSSSSTSRPTSSTTSSGTSRSSSSSSSVRSSSSSGTSSTPRVPPSSTLITTTSSLLSSTSTTVSSSTASSQPTMSSSTATISSAITPVSTSSIITFSRVQTSSTLTAETASLTTSDSAPKCVPTTNKISNPSFEDEVWSYNGPTNARSSGSWTADPGLNPAFTGDGVTAQNEGGSIFLHGIIPTTNSRNGFQLFGTVQNVKGKNPYRLSFYYALGESQSFKTCAITITFGAEQQGKPIMLEPRPAGQYILVERDVMMTQHTFEYKVYPSGFGLDIFCDSDGLTQVDILLDSFSLLDPNECAPKPTSTTSVSPLNTRTSPTTTNTRAPNDPAATCAQKPNSFPLDASGAESANFNNIRNESPKIIDKPFIPCGPGFDDELDIEYSFLAWDPSIAGNAGALRTYLGFGITGDVEYAWYTVDVAVGSLAFTMGLVRASTILTGVVASIDSAFNTAVDSINQVVDIFTTITASIGFTIPFDMTSLLATDSPWGSNSIPLYSSQLSPDDAGFSASKSKLESIISTYSLVTEPQPRLNVWCIDCGVKGSLSVSGSASVSVLKGPTSLRLELGGSLTAGVYLGIEAYVEKEAEFLKKRVFTAGLPGFTLPGIITIGPLITLDVDGKAGVSALGRVLAGAEVDFPEMKVVLDVIDTGASRISGFKPTVTTRFEAVGELTMSASLGLPIGVGVGIDILNGQFTQGIAVVSRPYIGAEAHWNTPTANDEDGCDGIDWSLGIGTEFELNVFDQTFGLGEFKGPDLASGCLGKTIPEGGEESTPIKPGEPDAVATPSPKSSAIYELPPVAQLLEAQGVTATPALVPGQTRLADVSGKFNLVANDDGNLYLGSRNLPGAVFQNNLNLVYGPSMTRWFAWHPDTMGAYGISRLRVVDASSAVKGQNIAMLAPATIGGRNLYMAMGTGFAPERPDLFYSLAWCNSNSYKGSRVFVVRNFEAAMEKLKSPEVQWIVTGAEISQCAPLILTHNVDPLVRG
ncbi:hypothetical protein ONS95_003611 [Cadophora gregata]|uniref:uncharacterized protein n=1 Tax=Cadophora gregata TaxID=51156 RepID=UPI0026DD4941|nr:uncharacterized protein ONS95_003611 [Cadophora gregata]KAK0106892.1 hypothetical protein ONS95_003611 [Cadophora gregata]KAK0116581.1 hypothetical protein ONS96_012438 [Cadophora gregata f. sp. sojae]